MIMIRSLLLPFLLLQPWLATALHAQQKMMIEVSAGAWPRYQTPIQAILSKPMPMDKAYQVVNTQTGKKAPAQLTDSITLIFILPDSLPSGKTARYQLREQPGNHHHNTMQIETKKEGLLIKAAQRPVLFYHITEALPPADSPAYYRRSGFIHPLYSPGGQILTDDFPAAHAHQHAIFTAWPNTTFRNDSVDFWNQHQKKGTVEHVEVIKQIQGPVVAQLQVLLHYKSLAHGNVLQEKWTLTVYPFTSYFLFDLASAQQNITTDTLYLNKYHYGGLAFRGSKQWNAEDKKYYTNNWRVVTSEGMTDSSANGTHARWVDASGKIDGVTAGATVFDHPGNFRYPQPIRVHPGMPYWAYAPVADGPFTIDPGAWYHARYRYYVHQGTAGNHMLGKIYKDWTEAPLVRVFYQ
jgi:hypothetical protein